MNVSLPATEVYQSPASGHDNHATGTKYFKKNTWMNFILPVFGEMVLTHSA